jgi:hypothetical protein
MRIIKRKTMIMTRKKEKKQKELGMGKKMEEAEKK